MKKVFITTLLLLIFVPSFFLVSAQTPTPVQEKYDERIENIKERQTLRQQKIDELKNATKEKRCNIISSNIEKITTAYNNRYSQQVDRYKKHATMIKETLDRIDNKGYDTSEVRELLKEFNEKVISYDNLRKDFQSLLNESKTLVCGESEGAYKTKVQEAVEVRKEMFELAKETNTFLKEELRPALIELKSQKNN